MNPTNNKRTLWAWAMYDFANSAFTTLVVTFIYGTYFTKAIAPNEILGTKWWSWAVSITAVLVSLLSPVLGALSDVGGYRKWIMMGSTWLCVGATALLFFPQEGQVVMALTLFVLANVTFEFGTVFCSAYLPEIASEDRFGRASGFAWGLGYVGGLMALGLALVLLVQPDVPILGFSTENGENIRATNLLVALWFFLFSIPAFLWVKDRKPEKGALRQSVDSSFSRLKKTFRELKNHQQVGRFLLARLVYNDALVTIFAFGGIYAAGVIGFSFEEIMLMGIVLNVTAGLGAFLMGYVDDKQGGRRTIQYSIVFLSLACLIAFSAPDLPGILELTFGGHAIPDWVNPKTLFWVAAIFIGFFSGPNQAASRSLMARFTPVEKRNEFFGFYAFSGKATSFLGPLLFGWATATFGTQQAGLVVVFVLFLLGYFLLKRVQD